MSQERKTDTSMRKIEYIEVSSKGTRMRGVKVLWSDGTYTAFDPRLKDTKTLLKMAEKDGIEIRRKDSENA